MTSPQDPIKRSRKGDSGFTLLEILLALTIFSLIAGAGTSVLISTFSTKTLVDGRLETLKSLERTTAFLRQDLNAARPRIWESSRRNAEPRSLFGGRPTAEGTLLGLVRSGWRNPDYVEDRSDLLAVEYRFNDGALTRHLILRPDATRNTPTQDTILLTGITNMEVSFRKTGQFSAQWDLAIDEGTALLPDTVNVRFEFEDGLELEQTFLVGAR